MADAPCSRSLPDRKNPGVFSLHGCLRVETPAAMSRPRRTIGACRPGASWRSAAANVDNVSYEEYHPYGTTAWWTDPGGTVSQKRYRYTGKEKDEESGLYYHGARYYPPWLARWSSADPSGLKDGPNRYAYVRNNPAGNHDPSGRGTVPSGGTQSDEDVSAELATFFPGLSASSLSQEPSQGLDIYLDEFVGVDINDVLTNPPPGAYGKGVANSAVLVPYNLTLGLVYTAMTPDGHVYADQVRSFLRPFKPNPENMEEAAAIALVEHQYQLSADVFMMTQGLAGLGESVMALGSRGLGRLATAVASGGGGTWSGLELTEGAAAYARVLRRPGDMVELTKHSLTLRDLGSLASHEQVEFAVVRIGETRYLVRGSAITTTLPEGTTKLIAHVHPGRGFFGLKASPEDFAAVADLGGGRSALVNESGAVRTYGGVRTNGVVEGSESGYLLNVPPMWGE